MLLRASDVLEVEAGAEVVLPAGEEPELSVPDGVVVPLVLNLRGSMGTAIPLLGSGLNAPSEVTNCELDAMASLVNMTFWRRAIWDDGSVVMAATSICIPQQGNGRSHGPPQVEH